MQQEIDAPIKRRPLETKVAGQIVTEAIPPKMFAPVRQGGDGYRVSDKAALFAAIQAARWAIQDSLSDGVGKKLAY